MVGWFLLAELEWLHLHLWRISSDGKNTKELLSLVESWDQVAEKWNSKRLKWWTSRCKLSSSRRSTCPSSTRFSCKPTWRLDSSIRPDWLSSCSKTAPDLPIALQTNYRHPIVYFSKVRKKVYDRFKWWTLNIFHLITNFLFPDKESRRNEDLKFLLKWNKLYGLLLVIHRLLRFRSNGDRSQQLVTSRSVILDGERADYF